MRRGSRLLGYGCALVSSALMATLLVVTGVAQQQAGDGPPTVRSRPVAMGSTYLCSGYSGCRDAGYSDAGYGARNDRMYWRMYAGHNCTNYAAYRMIKAGMSEERPWGGSGMAYNWGHAMAGITDRRPAVGAIAWWDRYEGGIGSSGHVAYVERVVSSDEIVISEDSWSGTFHWRTITRDSGRWPSGFIHFVDKSLANTTVPSVFGTPQVGVPLRASTGRWKPSAETFRYQWFADGAKIAGATGRAFTPAAAQRGKSIRVEVTAARPDFDAVTVSSASTKDVLHGQFTVEGPPSIDGDPFVGEVLEAVPATWSPKPPVTFYRWLANGRPIEGADGPTLRLTRALVGKNIKVTTSAAGPGYRRSPTRSAPVGPVVIGEIEVVQEYGVSGAARVGEELSVVPGVVDPADAKVAYQWLRDGVSIEGATAATYELTGDDLGKQVRLLVTLSRTNYATRKMVVGPETTVTTRPTVAVRPVGKPGRAVVWVRVVAPGATDVKGRVVVTIAGEQRGGWLDDGRVRLVVGDLAAGDRTVRVAYEGTSAIEPRSAQSTVHIYPAGSGRMQAGLH